MTDQELRDEFDRVIKDVYPLIASEYLDKEIVLKASNEISYEVEEWRGRNFPYEKLNREFMILIKKQFLTTNMYDILYRIGESEVVGFLNRYYHWAFEEQEKMRSELDNNTFELSERDKEEFEKFKKQKPYPFKEPLDVEGYLHMCRTAYDAAPMCVYPDFISDLYVVASAKFDSCGLADKDMHEKMQVGDSTPEFMRYHSEEMGFGGPRVCFEWNEEGWIMNFIGKGNGGSEREINMDIHRFLAMRRAGYPVVYCTSEY